MGLEVTHAKVVTLRAAFREEPGPHALRLAQQLSWYSMELALDRQYRESRAH